MSAQINLSSLFVWVGKVTPLKNCRGGREGGSGISALQSSARSKEPSIF